MVATYGLAEHTVFVCRATAPKRREFDSTSLAEDRIVPGKGTVLFGCGRCDDIELAIVRDRKRVVGGVGEIWVRSPSRARGYWRAVESSAETFGGYLDEEAPVTVGEDGTVAPQGWLRTGDLGFIDDEGDLFVLTRRPFLRFSELQYHEYGDVTPPRRRRRGRERVYGSREATASFGAGVRPVQGPADYQG